MLSKRLAGALAGLALMAALVCGMVLAAPSPAEAQRFSAGDFSDGICSCPVVVGDCVCKFTPPVEEGPSPEEPTTIAN